MKTKMKLFFILITFILFNTCYVPIYAFDSMDLINNMTMDMMLDQSYHTIESGEMIADLSLMSDFLNHDLIEFMFFPDNLAIFQDSGTEFNNTDTLMALENGSWQPEFNDFFKNFDIPMDVEMHNMDYSDLSLPAFTTVDNILGNDFNNPNMDLAVSSPEEAMLEVSIPTENSSMLDATNGEMELLFNVSMPDVIEPPKVEEAPPEVDYNFDNDK